MKNDDATLVDAIDLLDLCVEYIYYYSLLKEYPREEFLEEIKSIILNNLNFISEDYFFDENEDLMVPSHLVELKKFLGNLSKSLK